MSSRRALDLIRMLPVIAVGALALGIAACAHEKTVSVGSGELRGDAPEAGEESPAARPAPGIWWNRPRFVEALRLTEEQRQDLDLILERHRVGRRQQAARYRQAQQERARALSDGDWDEARAAGEDLAELAAASSRDETELFAAVLQRLDAEQRRTLNESFPLLLRRPWMIGGGGARARAAAATRR